MSNPKTTGSVIIETDKEIKVLAANMTEKLDAAELALSNLYAKFKTMLARLDEARASNNSRRQAALHKKLEKDEYQHVIEAREQNVLEGKKGSVRVGKMSGRFEKGSKHPHTEGYLNVIVISHNKTAIGSELSPFVLKRGNIFMENLWQCSKLYPFVPEIKDRNDGWKWDREVHIDKRTQNIKPEYWKWRKAGITYSEPLRYPAGSDHKKYCKAHVWPTNGSIDDAINMSADTPRVELPYVDARIKIYCPVYMELAKETEDFHILQEMLNDGYNLQILDIDGPKRATGSDGQPLPPYDTMPDGNSGEDGVGSIEINGPIIEALLVDTAQPFGHGYALACALLGHPEWITEFDMKKIPTDSID
jgi:hypothetical protein